MLTNSPKILVVGGAGYIGSQMVLTLQSAGYEPLVLDNLVKGHADAVINAKLIVGDMADKALLQKIFSEHEIAAVMHFASYIEVGESVQNPLKYYQNNVSATLNLLETMLQHHIKQFIFSSTAAVFGEPQYVPIDEAHLCVPINPYGQSKYMVECVMHDLAKSDGLQYASLRYFNAAGADPEGRVGERHQPESHLIPLLLQVAAGTRESMTVFGRDYPTPDGTCVRDYIHISDLCDAHLLALKELQNGKNKLICNLGNGQGFSVQEVIDTVKQVTGRPILVKEGSRRVGDPAVLVADASVAKQMLGWQPKFSDLKTIVQHAWDFCSIG